VTEIAPIVPKRFDATLRVSRPALTNEQVFRLWRCAIKDDDSLVDELILQVYENIVTFDRKRAECVMELMIGAAWQRVARSDLFSTMCAQSANRRCYSLRRLPRMVLQHAMIDRLAPYGEPSGRETIPSANVGR
jgi:hypothetical protein